MTGEKNRYTTTEKLWKLDDDTLKTPKHDEMVLWLLDVTNISKILPWRIEYNTTFAISGLGSYTAQRLFNKIDHVWGALQSKKGHGLYISNKMEREESDKTWSEMIVEYHECNDFNIFNIQDFNIKINSEVPITANNGFLVGYCDITVEIILPMLYIGNYFKTGYVLNGIHNGHLVNHIEVKPTIKSFGETLRQLNTYKHYLQTDQLYLFTTDLRFKDAFESQGITVLTYPIE